MAVNVTGIKMSFFGGSLLAGVELWSNKTQQFEWAELVFDTGAGVTVLSADDLFSKGIIRLKKVT